MGPETPVVGVVVVTHGRVAAELLNAAEMIVGELPQCTAVSIGWHDDVNEGRDQIARAIGRVEGGRGVLILTDMFGGTPSNLGISLLAQNQVEVVTGVNLPMVIKAVTSKDAGDLLAVARAMREHARSTIRVASDLMRREDVGEEGH